MKTESKLPGFTGLLPAGSASNEIQTEAPVRLAGLWDVPDQKTCRFVRTDTTCTLLVLWCTEVYVCRDPSNFFGYEEKRTPYPCGVCFGFPSPDDW